MKTEDLLKTSEGNRWSLKDSRSGASFNYGIK